MTTTVILPKAEWTPLQQPKQSLWNRISCMLSVSRQRRVLKSLDADMLDDIGVTRTDAIAEAEKPVWDVPQYWAK